MNNLEPNTELAESGFSDYGLGLRAAVRGFWSGVFDRIQFLDTMVSLIRRRLRQAFHEGAAEMGIKPEELTGEELIALDNHINEQYGYIAPFADDIESANKAAGGKLGPLLKRTRVWQNRYNEVRAHAKLLAGLDRKMQWILHGKRVTKDPCEDCLKLNGRIYRGKVWAAYDIRPQSPRLACGGWNCGCDWVATDEKVTPGRPPKLAGAER